MQVGGRVTEVDGEEGLYGWDVILQHNHDPVVELNMANTWTADDTDHQSYHNMTRFSLWEYNKSNGCFIKHQKHIKNYKYRSMHVIYIGGVTVKWV